MNKVCCGWPLKSDNSFLFWGRMHKMSSAAWDLSFLGGAQSSSRQLSTGQDVRGCFRELWRQWARRWRINTRNESSYSSGLYECSSMLHYAKGTSKLLMLGLKLLLQLVCVHKWGQFLEPHASSVITWSPELGTLILGMVLLQREALRPQWTCSLQS